MKTLIAAALLSVFLAAESRASLVTYQFAGMIESAFSLNGPKLKGASFTGKATFDTDAASDPVFPGRPGYQSFESALQEFSLYAPSFKFESAAPADVQLTRFSLDTLPGFSGHYKHGNFTGDKGSIILAFLNVNPAYNKVTSDNFGSLGRLGEKHVLFFAEERMLGFSGVITRFRKEKPEDDHSAPLPEPASVALLASGLFAAGAFVRRRSI